MYFFTNTNRKNEYKIIELNGRFRLINHNDHDLRETSAQHRVMWESDNRQDCEKALQYLNTITESSKAYMALDTEFTQDGPHDTKLKFSKGYVSVVLAGKEIAKASFIFVDQWSCNVIAGLPKGALTASSISILDGYQKKGIGSAIHDFVSQITGLPTVPNSVNEALGALSEKAQGFWAKRSQKMFIHGITDREDTDKRAYAYYNATLANRISKYRIMAKNSDKSFQFAMEVNRQLGWSVGQVAGERLGDINWISVSPDGKQFLTSLGLQNASEHYIEEGKSFNFIGVMPDTLVKTLHGKWLADKQENHYITPVSEEMLSRDVREVATKSGLSNNAPSLEEMKAVFKNTLEEHTPRLSALLDGKPDPYRTPEAENPIPKDKTEEQYVTQMYAYVS